MIGRTVFRAVIAVATALLLAVPVSAEADDVTNAVLDAAGAGPITENIPESAEELSGGLTPGDGSAISPGTLLDAVYRLSAKLIRGALKTFSPLFGFIVIAASARAAAGAFPESTASRAFEYLSLLVLSGFTFSILREDFHAVCDFLEAILAFFTGLLPVMSSLYVLGGNIGSATVSGTAMSLILSLVSRLSSSFVMPSLNFCFGASIASHIGGRKEFSGLTAFIRTSCITVLTFVLSIISAGLVFANTLALSGDTLGAHAVKFAASSFIPVVGSAVGDAARAVLGSIAAVRGTIGVFGVAVLLYTVLVPILTLTVHRLALLFCTFCARLLGCEREASFLSDAGTVLTAAISVLICVSVSFVIALAVFIRTATVV